MALTYYVLLLAILAVSLILALIPWRPPALRAAMAAAHLVVTVVIVVLYLRAPYGAGPWLVCSRRARWPRWSGSSASQ